MPERTDPFTALRLPTTPLAPRPAFVAALRQRLEAALAPARAEAAPPRPDPEPQETTMSDTQIRTTSVLSPYLIVDGAAAAIDWYRQVLGAVETTRFVGDDGRIGHAELVIGGARIMLADEYPEMDIVGPAARGGSSVSLHLEVVDVDHSHRLAVETGARSERPPADQGHGNRNATIFDPFGHRWMLSQAIDAERTAAAEAESGRGGDGSTWAVTGRTPVEPGYLVLRTADLERARTFYGEVFAWSVGGGSVEGGGHVENTRFPLGFSPPADEATIVMFRVDDIEPYAHRIEERGGRVLERHQYPSGASAECVDDQGYRFDLWQAAPGY